MPIPKLSIVIPVYNVEQYIKECLDSIIYQSYTDLEILVINDCSPTNEEAIILEYQQKDSRIKYIKHEVNLGLGGARNTGIKNATGEWIAFVDSDDYVELNCFENMIRLLEKTPDSNLGIFSAINVHDNKKYYDSYFNVENINNFPFISVTAWGKIFKTSDLIENKIYFPEYLKHEDEEFWLKYNAVIKPTYVADTQTYYQYRQRQNSITTNTYSRLDIPFVLNNVYEFIQIHSPEDRHYLMGVLQHLTSIWMYYRMPITHQFIFFQRVYETLRKITLTQQEIQQLSQIIQQIYNSRSKLQVVYIVLIHNLLNVLKQDHSSVIQLCKRILRKLIHIGFKVPIIKKILGFIVTNSSLQKEYNNIQAEYHKLQEEYNNIQEEYGNKQAEYHKLQEEYNNIQEEYGNKQAEYHRLRNITDQLVNCVKNQPKIIYLDTPEHGNLGDQAIAESALDLLKDLFPQQTILEFTYNDWLRFPKLIIDSIFSDDIIFTIGGGNLGSLWINEEEVRRSIMQHFPNNKIISMPQSITFADDSTGEEQLKLSQKVYNSHSDLTIMTRGKISFQKSEEYFPNVKHILAPDSVLYWNNIYSNISNNREGVLFVIREDKEKLLDENTVKTIQQFCSQENILYQSTDTVVHECFSAKTRRVALENLFNQFASAKIIITDRLHGMIFAAITRTPCIVFSSLDHKIVECYEWIKDIEYIYYAPSDQQITELIKFYQNNEVESKTSKIPQEILTVYQELLSI